jgi:hypothetical protein
MCVCDNEMPSGSGLAGARQLRVSKNDLDPRLTKGCPRQPEREKARHRENGGHSGAPSSVASSRMKAGALQDETLGSVSGVLQFVTNDEAGRPRE